jgi:hypothetical protein
MKSRWHSSLFISCLTSRLALHRNLPRNAVGTTTLVSALTLASLACQPTRDADLPESPRSALPITKVVLYQNGVGYFEREGLLAGDNLTLQVRPSQINDLLKSLTIVDKSDGRAISVSLPLEKSADQALSELPEQVRNAGGLLQLLTVFRGARVEVDGKSGSFLGRVVGLENIPQPPTVKGEAEVPKWQLTLASDAGELEVVPFEEIQRVTILDDALAVGLDRSLDVSLKEGDWKPVSITVRFTGEDDHPLTASYVVEMPRWKPAYRIVLGGTKPLLQGWAVVDNVSGEDWNGVKLSLVAGTPVSFVYDLHSSQFVARTDLSPRRLTAAPPPPVEAGGVAMAEEAPAPEVQQEDGYGYSYDGDALSGALTEKRASVAKAAPPMAPTAPRPATPLDQTLQSQFLAETQTAQVGSLFRYDLQSPVSVPDRTSTLVNIINSRVSAAEVAMFRPEYIGGTLPTHPYRAVRLTNDTPFTLEQGPVTIYSDGTFLGEGLLERVEPNSTHFLGFSLDSHVSLSSDSSYTSGESKVVHIHAGVFTLEVQNQELMTHSLRNLHEEAITAFLKTDRRADWTLENPPAGVVETPDALWVPVRVPGRGSAKLELNWKQKSQQSTNIDTDMDAERLVVTLRNTKLPPEVDAGLQLILAVKREADSVDREVSQVEKLKATLEADQARVRDNLDTLRKTKGNAELQHTLAQKIAKLEQQLGETSGRLVQLMERRAELSKQMSDMLAKLEF